MTKRIMLYFPVSETEKPISYTLAKEYDLMINVYRASVTPEEAGYMLIDVTGEEENISKGILYLESLNIEVSENQKGLRWDSKLCVSCGACLTHCPTAALHIPDRTTMKVEFNNEKCVECLNCIKVCPFNACESLF